MCCTSRVSSQAFCHLLGMYTQDNPAQDRSSDRLLVLTERGMDPEGCEQDVLRLSCALDIVMRQAVKNKIRYSVSQANQTRRLAHFGSR